MKTALLPKLIQKLRTTALRFVAASNLHTNTQRNTAHSIHSINSPIAFNECEMANEFSPLNYQGKQYQQSRRGPSPEIAGAA